jgi:hypothetical protein
VPTASPVTIPDVVPIVATVTLLLTHVPPVSVLPKVVVNPRHTAGVPEIADGSGLTVNTLMVLQPVGNVYVIFAVPAATPSTIPVPGPIAATDGLLLPHPPLGEASVSVVLNPSHTCIVPLIDAGKGFTVTIFEEIHPVGNV